MHLCTNPNPGLGKVLSSILYQKSLQYWTFLLCKSVNGPHWDLWPNLAVWERWGNGRWIDVRRCSNDCLSCLETHPRRKRNQTPSVPVLWSVVCAWACSHAWWLNRHQLLLYARLLLRRGSLITFLLPQNLSFSFSCLPLAPPFRCLFLLLLSLYDRTDRKLSSRSHCLRTLSP